MTGLPDAWYEVRYDSAEPLSSGERRRGSVTITVPQHGTGGSYSFEVSAISASAESTARAAIEVESGGAGALADFAAAEKAAGLTPEAAPEDEPAAPEVTLEAGLIMWRGQGQVAERKVLQVRNPGAIEADYSA